MTRKPTWRLRRRVTIGTLLFCGAVFVWVLATGVDTEINRLALEIVGTLAGAVLAVYTGAKTALNLRGRLPYYEQDGDGNPWGTPTPPAPGGGS